MKRIESEHVTKLSEVENEWKLKLESQLSSQRSALLQQIQQLEAKDNQLIADLERKISELNRKIEESEERERNDKLRYQLDINLAVKEKENELNNQAREERDKYKSQLEELTAERDLLKLSVLDQTQVENQVKEMKIRVRDLEAKYQNEKNIVKQLREENEKFAQINAEKMKVVEIELEELRKGINTMNDEIAAKDRAIDARDRRISELESSTVQQKSDSEADYYKHLLETERKSAENTREELATLRSTFEKEQRNMDKDREILQSLKTQLDMVNKTHHEEVQKLREEKEALEEEVRILVEEKQDIDEAHDPEVLKKLQDKITLLTNEQFSKMNAMTQLKVEISSMQNTIAVNEDTISQLRSKLSKAEQSVLQIKDQYEAQLESTQKLERKIIEANEQIELKVQEVRTQLEKENKARVNELIRERDLVKLELSQQNEEIEDLRRKLTANDDIITKQKLKLSELENKPQTRRESKRLSKNLGSLDSIIESQKALEQQSVNQELEKLREQVKMLTAENRKFKERKSSIMQPAQKRVTRNVNNIKQENLEQNEESSMTVIPNAVTRRRSTVNRSSSIIRPQLNDTAKFDLAEANRGGSDILASINKNGFLTKEGDKFKTWHRRWFRIIKEEGTGSYALAYYQNLGELKAIKSIPLGGAIVQLATEKENGTNRLYCFKLKTSGRTFFLNASSEDDRADWMKCLNVVINQMK
jgi:hypothetical protein